MALESGHANAACDTHDLHIVGLVTLNLCLFYESHKVSLTCWISAASAWARAEGYLHWARDHRPRLKRDDRPLAPDMVFAMSDESDFRP